MNPLDIKQECFRMLGILLLFLPIFQQSLLEPMSLFQEIGFEPPRGNAKDQTKQLSSPRGGSRTKIKKNQRKKVVFLGRSRWREIFQIDEDAIY